MSQQANPIIKLQNYNSCYLSEQQAEISLSTMPPVQMRAYSEQYLDPVSEKVSKIVKNKGYLEAVKKINDTYKLGLTPEQIQNTLPVISKITGAKIFHNGKYYSIDLPENLQPKIPKIIDDVFNEEPKKSHIPSDPASAYLNQYDMDPRDRKEIEQRAAFLKAARKAQKEAKKRQAAAKPQQARQARKGESPPPPPRTTPPPEPGRPDDRHCPAPVRRLAQRKPLTSPVPPSDEEEDYSEEEAQDQPQYKPRRDPPQSEPPRRKPLRRRDSDPRLVPSMTRRPIARPHLPEPRPPQAAYEDFRASQVAHRRLRQKPQAPERIRSSLQRVPVIRRSPFHDHGFLLPFHRKLATHQLSANRHLSRGIHREHIETDRASLGAARSERPARPLVKAADEPAPAREVFVAPVRYLPDGQPTGFLSSRLPSWLSWRSKKDSGKEKPAQEQVVEKDQLQKDALASAEGAHLVPPTDPKIHVQIPPPSPDGQPSPDSPDVFHPPLSTPIAQDPSLESHDGLQKAEGSEEPSALGSSNPVVRSRAERNRAKRLRQREAKRSRESEHQAVADQSKAKPSSWLKYLWGDGEPGGL